MKLRQKLAVVLASAMVVTSVPVVTMAASDNRPVKETLIVKKDSGLTLADGAGVAIELKDFDKQANVDPDFVDVFYLDLENAEWDGTIKAYVPGTDDVEEDVTITAVNSTTIKVQATTSAAFVVPLVVKEISGDAKVSINKKGSFSTVTEGSWIFATTGEKVAKVEVGTSTAFYTKGKIAPITITETYKGSMKDGLTFRVELQDGDFEVLGTGTVEASYGFAGKTVIMNGKVIIRAGETLETPVAATADQLTNAENIVITSKINPDNNKDYGVVEYTVKGAASVDSLGTLKIKDIEVASTTKTPEEGDLLVDILNVNATGLVEEKQNVKVATISSYGTYIEMKDKKAVEVKAGTAKEVEFTIGEIVNDSLVGNREIELTLDKGHFVQKAGATTNLRVIKENGKDVTEDKQVVEDIRFTYANDEDKAAGIVETVIITLVEGLHSNEKIDTVTLKGLVCVPVSEKDEETITIKAEGRALENKEISTEAVSIINPFNIETEEMRVKVGLQNQVGGKITLTETDKAMFGKGEIKLTLAKDAASGISFSGKATLEVDGDLKKADIKDTTTKGQVSINIGRQSKSASSITISDLQVTVDRTVPEGSYDLVISGTSIDGNEHEIVVENFFVVGTPNTEDIAANGLRRGTTTFVVGEAKYTANGIAYDMTAQSYIQDPGYTMIPVRYVAEAFGVAQKDILFSNGTATIFAGERTIQLTNGSDVAVVNGAQIKMATKVVIKDGRTYAPVGEIARILGISSSWDNTTKTATFVNN